MSSTYTAAAVSPGSVFQAGHISQHRRPQGTAWEDRAPGKVPRLCVWCRTCKTPAVPPAIELREANRLQLT